MSSHATLGALSSPFKSSMELKSWLSRPTPGTNGAARPSKLVLALLYAASISSFVGKARFSFPFSASPMVEIT